MAHTITIETESDKDFDLLNGLAERLGLSAQESFTQKNPSRVEQQAAFRKFVGSWKGNESADELEAIIYAARKDQPRNLDI